MANGVGIKVIWQRVGMILKRNSRPMLELLKPPLL